MEQLEGNLTGQDETRNRSQNAHPSEKIFIKEESGPSAKQYDVDRPDCKKIKDDSGNVSVMQQGNFRAFNDYGDNDGPAAGMDHLQLPQ